MSCPMPALIMAAQVLSFTPRLLWLLRLPRCDYATHNLSLPTSLANRVVWITGASSGIGLALAHVLASRGARLILTSRSADALRAVAATLPCPSSRIAILPADLSSATPDALATLAHDATHAFEDLGPAPRLDFLFNNAGQSSRAVAADMRVEDIARQLALNFTSPVALALAALPALRASDVGSIINTSSIASLISTPLRAPYCASKAGLSRFFECMRLEMTIEKAEDRVRIVDVCPGSVKTRIAHNAMTKEGAVHGKEDGNIEAGLDAEFVAERMVAAAVAGSEIVWLAKGKEMIAVYLAWYVPVVWRWIGPGLLRRNFVEMMESSG